MKYLLRVKNEVKLQTERPGPCCTSDDLAIAQAAEFTALKTALEQKALQAATQLELAKNDAQIERKALQSTIDRLLDQVGELKSLLHKPPQN